MFVFVRGILKSNLPAKLLIAVCLCLITALTFVACKDKDIYAESSDFESYPDYWNDFNNDNGDIYVSKEDQSNTSTTPDTDNSNSSDGDELTSSEKDFIEDFKNNIDKEDDNTSSTIDTDNDGVTDDKDTDDDGDGIPDDDEVNYGNQGPFVPVK